MYIRPGKTTFAMLKKLLFQAGEYANIDTLALRRLPKLLFCSFRWYQT